MRWYCLIVIGYRWIAMYRLSVQLLVSKSCTTASAWMYEAWPLPALVAVTGILESQLKLPCALQWLRLSCLSILPKPRTVFQPQALTDKQAFLLWVNWIWANLMCSRRICDFQRIAVFGELIISAWDVATRKAEMCASCFSICLRLTHLRKPDVPRVLAALWNSFRATLPHQVRNCKAPPNPQWHSDSICYAKPMEELQVRLWTASWFGANISGSQESPGSLIWVKCLLKIETGEIPDPFTTSNGFTWWFIGGLELRESPRVFPQNLRDITHITRISNPLG